MKNRRIFLSPRIRMQNDFNKLIIKTETFQFIPIENIFIVQVQLTAFHDKLSCAELSTVPININREGISTISKHDAVLWARRSYQTNKTRVLHNSKLTNLKKWMQVSITSDSMPNTSRDSATGF
jgi:hypothetical protein